MCPLQTGTGTHQKPYPNVWVRVSWGRNMGSPRKPQGYPCQSLVATGNVEYHPLYFSIGNIHNTAQHAHGNAVVPIGFLAIPKSMYIH